MTKRLFADNSFPTDDSRAFGSDIETAIVSIFKEYLAKGFCIRDLSHEAQSVVSDVELDYLMSLYAEDAEKAIEKRNLKAIEKQEEIIEEKKEEKSDYRIVGTPIKDKNAFKPEFVIHPGWG